MKGEDSRRAKEGPVIDRRGFLKLAAGAVVASAAGAAPLSALAASPGVTFNINPDLPDHAL